MHFFNKFVADLKNLIFKKKNNRLFSKNENDLNNAKTNKLRSNILETIINNEIINKQLLEKQFSLRIFAVFRIYGSKKPMIFRSVAGDCFAGIGNGPWLSNLTNGISQLPLFKKNFLLTNSYAHICK